MTERASSFILRALPPASFGPTPPSAHAPAASSAGVFVDRAKAVPLPARLLRSPSLTAGFERHCIAEFEHLAQTSPTHLVELARAEFMNEPVLLAQSAEALALASGGSSLVRPFLLALLRHPRAYVREAAVVGISSHVDESVRGELEKIAGQDGSPGVREAAAEVLGLL